MKTLTTKLALTAIIAATVIGALAGCTATTAAPKPTHSSTAVAPPKPTTASVVKAPIVGDLNGDGVVDGWEKDQLARSTYLMPDGSRVAIPADQPIPAPVIAAVQASVAQAAGKSVVGASAEVMGAQAHASATAIAVESSKLGRAIVPVFYVYSPNDGAYVWTVGGAAQGTIKNSTSEPVALAAANAWISSRTSQFVVVEFNQK